MSTSGDQASDTHSSDSPLPAASYPPTPAPRSQTALERLASARKGKGKAEVVTGGNTERGQREHVDSRDDEADGPAGMSFSVRFTEGQEDLVDLWVGERESVREVKRRVCRQLAVATVLELTPRTRRSAFYGPRCPSRVGHAGFD